MLPHIEQIKYGNGNSFFNDVTADTSASSLVSVTAVEQC